MDAPLKTADFASYLPDAPFREVHDRTISAPIETVWQAFLTLPADEIRLLRPLFALRALPTMLRGRRGPMPSGAKPVLEMFEDEGFIILGGDDKPTNGHAQLLFGAAGQFWAPAHNTPIRFESPESFRDFDAPGNAKTVARFEAWAEGPSTTRIETETVVDVTDPASKLKFGAYWTIIRGPSGLLRRSWLAGVDRRAS